MKTKPQHTIRKRNRRRALPFKTNARTGRAVSKQNRRRSAGPAIIAAIMAAAAVALAIAAAK
jgi:hypothetical protein